MMYLVPVSLDEAKEFVRRIHRHNRPPVSWKFGVGLEKETLADFGQGDEPCQELIGVAIAGRPVARELDKIKTNIEITRVCVHDTKNGNSKLYGAILRAARNLGYRMAYTYTLQSESGASLKASGWVVDAELDARETWSCQSRHRVQTNMFGEEQRPAEAKIRWKHPL